MIDLANEVRKVLGIMGNVLPKDKKLVGLGQLTHHHEPIPVLQLHQMPEPIALDS